MSDRPEVVVKKYKNSAAANRDAGKMAAAGWVPAGMAGGGTQRDTSLGNYLFGSGGNALGFGWSKVEQPITMTWTRTPQASAEAARIQAAVLRNRAIAAMGGEAAFVACIDRTQRGEPVKALGLKLRQRMALMQTEDYKAAVRKSKSSRSG